MKTAFISINKAGTILGILLRLCSCWRFSLTSCFIESIVTWIGREQKVPIILNLFYSIKAKKKEVAAEVLLLVFFIKHVTSLQFGSIKLTLH